MKTQTNKGQKQTVLGSEIELSIEELEQKVAPGSLVPKPLVPEPLEPPPLEPPPGIPFPR
jgi:hypothetical protein